MFTKVTDRPIANEARRNRDNERTSTTSHLSHCIQ